jgi:hypothetical protein
MMEEYKRFPTLKDAMKQYANEESPWSGRDHIICLEFIERFFEWYKSKHLGIEESVPEEEEEEKYPSECCCTGCCMSCLGMSWRDFI